MNTFDFYVVKAISSKKTPLKPIQNLAGGRIESIKIGYKSYGRDSYPIYHYSVSLGYVDVSGKSSEKIESELNEITEKFKGFDGVRLSSIYIARD